jgi:hypothetical protein
MSFRMYMHQDQREIYKPLAVAESERQAEILQYLGYRPITRQEFIQIAAIEKIPIPEPLPEEPIYEAEQPTQMRLF